MYSTRFLISQYKRLIRVDFVTLLMLLRQNISKRWLSEMRTASLPPRVIMSLPEMDRAGDFEGGEGGRMLEFIRLYACFRPHPYPCLCPELMTITTFAFFASRSAPNVKSRHVH